MSLISLRPTSHPAFSYPVRNQRRRSPSPTPSRQVPLELLKRPIKPEQKSPSAALKRLRAVAQDLINTNHSLPLTPTLGPYDKSARDQVTLWELCAWVKVNMVYEPLLVFRQEAIGALEFLRAELGFHVELGGDGIWELGDIDEFWYWQAELNAYNDLWTKLRLQDEPWLSYRISVRGQHRMGLSRRDRVNHLLHTHTYRPLAPALSDTTTLLSITSKIRPEFKRGKTGKDGAWEMFDDTVQDEDLL